MTGLALRDSGHDNVPAIQSICTHHVRHGTVSFELEPPTPDEMPARRAAELKDGFPWLGAQAACWAMRT
jgi:L-amino acid N-acyltransferase YncA